MRSDVLVAEISGKRPGGKNKRHTEKYDILYDHLIISNNSEGYETDWQIINVPDDYKEWYMAHCKTSDNAWYAPMNRSYAIKYAREHGYKYLVQLDDNIVCVMLEYLHTEGVRKRMRIRRSHGEMLNDFIGMLICVLENTNAGMAGCNMAGVAQPDDRYFLAERYCYSLFALKLDVCPDVFQGDFEDDIEFRLKLGQMGIPAVQVNCMTYGKTGQAGSKDESGNRAAYTAAGVLRGKHMSKLYGDKYSCRMRNRTNGINAKKNDTVPRFKHILKPWKVGILVRDRKAIDDEMQRLFKKYAEKHEDKYVLKEKKVKKRV